MFKQKVDGSQYLATEQYIAEPQPSTVNGLAYALNTSWAVLTDYDGDMHDEKAELRRSR